MMRNCGLPCLRKRFVLLNLSIAFLLAFSGCDNTGNRNEANNSVVQGSTELATAFEKQIIPIFERRCSVSCHGVDKDSYEQFLRKDAINTIAFYFPYDSKTGKIQRSDLDLIYKMTFDHDRVDYSEGALFSHLLRAPLAEEFGGEPHRGLDVFYSTDDADFKIFKNWLNREIAAHKKEHKPLPENIAYFEKHILGVMERNSCFLSSCHGNQVFNDLKLIPPLPTDDIGTETAIKSGFSRKMVLANRAVMLGKVSRLANLGGDLKQSRLIVKNLPISEGGIHQRGGNTQFFESLEDEDVKHLLNWLKLERKSLARHLASEQKPINESDLGKIKGMVFIRGPRHTPRTWFSFDKYYPGSDIFILPLKEGETLPTASATPISLTAAFYDAPVEIQSLDVRYDAKRIVFSMRSDADKGFRLYELRLDESMSGVVGKPEQISFAAAALEDGTLIHHVDPVYIPGPVDKEGHELGEVAIAFASNESGQYAQSDMWGILGEADSSVGSTLLDKQRPEAAGTFNGRRISIVSGPNKGEWRTIVGHEADSGKGSGARLVLDRPLPNKVDRNTIYVIEKERALVQSSYDIWRFVPQSVEMKAHAVKHDPNELEGLNVRQRFEKTRHQMTYTYAQERRPTLRTTGETMLTSVRNIGYQGDKPIFNGAIYRLQAGGFDYHIQGGNRSGYPLYSDSRELGNGLEVRQVHDPRNLWSGGLLVLADHGFGINLESDNPMDDIPYSYDADPSEIAFSSPPRFIPAQVKYFDAHGEQAVTHTGISPGGSARDPYPLLNGSILTSFTPHELNHLDPNADPDWDLYVFEFVNSPHTEAGDKAGVFRRLKIAPASTELAEYSPRPLMLRLKENAHRPIHHQKFGSRTNTIIPKEEFGVLKMPDGLPGEIECYDYPLLQSFLTNFAPAGAKDFRIQHGNPDGSVTADDQLFKYIRVIMQVPASKEELQPIHSDYTEGDPFATAVSSGIHTRRVIVSEAPIEDDGSFYIEVPSKVPLILQGLNSDKMAMHSMNRWFYLQPGEKLTFGIPRSIYPLRCAGCHGSLTGDPIDGVGPVDLVSASSRVMATWNDGEQKRRPAFGFNQENDEYIGIDFNADVQPILNRHCIACHNSESGRAGLDLRDITTKHYNRAYESLHQLTDVTSGNHADKKYVNEREALSSESLLIQSLLGKNGETHLQGKPLTNQEMMTLIRWIDLGATYKGVNVKGGEI
jgi:mono/diheme cytochrome c family protein